MYYIFYQFKTGKVGYDEYFKESDVLVWILKNGGHCLSYKIFEAVKVYRLGLIEIGKGKSIRKCRKCGGPIGEQNTSGYCNSCVGSTRLEKSERLCTVCGKNKITAWNKSGLCTSCRNRAGYKLRNKKRKQQRQEKKKKSKALEIKKEGGNLQAPPIETKSIDKDLPVNTPNKNIGTCRKCSTKFKLESWQHSSMHWCPECRKSGDYKEFRE